MSFRSDKNAGTIICGLGIAMVVLGAFCLGIVGLQRVVIASMLPIQPGPGTANFMAGMDGLHRICLLYLPVMILGGMVFAVSGFYIRRGSLVARRCAQLNAVCGYVWGFCNAFSCWKVGSHLGPPPGIPSTVYFAMQIVCGVGGVLMFVAIPTVLLLILNRPKTQT